MSSTVLLGILWVLLSVGRRRSDPPGPNEFSSILSELFHRSDIALDDPVVDVANTEVFGIVDIKIGCLPLVVFIGLPMAGYFHIQLLNAETVLARHRDAAGAALRAHPAEPGGVIGEGEFQAVDVGGQIDVVTVRVLIDKDASVIPGHDHVAQDGQGSVVAGWGNDARRAVGGLGRLHVVAIGVDEDVLKLALRRVFQVDAADAWIVICADIQIFETHVGPRE